MSLPAHSKRSSVLRIAREHLKFAAKALRRDSALDFRRSECTQAYGRRCARLMREELRPCRIHDSIELQSQLDSHGWLA
jgi:hypothetical protein